jgi:hypothetical protein
MFTSTILQLVTQLKPTPLVFEEEPDKTLIEEIELPDGYQLVDPFDTPLDMEDLNFENHYSDAVELGLVDDDTRREIGEQV